MVGSGWAGNGKERQEYIGRLISQHLQQTYNHKFQKHRPTTTVCTQPTNVHFRY